MSWYSTGHEAAEAMAAATQTRRTRNFYTRPGESAVIRFLSPAKDSFNYKRCFVRQARGQKLLTSPGVSPDPFVEAGLSLQTAFAWKIIDRRILEFQDRQTGEDKKIGPRVLYFADGTRTRKQLLAFEKEMLDSENEERAENGQDPLTLEEFNLTSYDLKVSKEKGAPWNFVAKRPKKLSKADIELIEDPKNEFDLMEELKPLPIAELKALLSGAAASEESDDDDEEEAAYSYEKDDDTIKFED